MKLELVKYVVRLMSGRNLISPATQKQKQKKDTAQVCI